MSDKPYWEKTEDELRRDFQRDLQAELDKHGAVIYGYNMCAKLTSICRKDFEQDRFFTPVLCYPIKFRNTFRED